MKIPFIKRENKCASKPQWDYGGPSGAGGIRTLVQIRKPAAFYMLILPWFSSRTWWKTNQNPTLVAIEFRFDITTLLKLVLHFDVL